MEFRSVAFLVWCLELICLPFKPMLFCHATTKCQALL